MVQCAPGAVKLSYTEPDGQGVMRYSVVKFAQSWVPAITQDAFSEGTVDNALQRLATQQHAWVCLPLVYPNAPQAPQT